MVRQLLIAGNWKMNGSSSHTRELLTAIKTGLSAFNDIEVLVCPPFTYLSQAHELLTNSDCRLGAQNLYLGAEGAFTGEISGSMLVEMGCQYVLVGHSERRAIFQEDLALVAEKCKAALSVGLTPILCVGETQTEREQAQTEQIITEQLNSVISFLGIEAFEKIIIAYEPVWAIGTGLTATPSQAEAIHLFIRQLISKNKVDIAQTIRILYGGSMKAENAALLLAMPNIDGGLIGGASLNANSFIAICAAANQQMVAARTVLSG